MVEWRSTYQTAFLFSGTDTESDFPLGSCTTTVADDEDMTSTARSMCVCVEVDGVCCSQFVFRRALVLVC